MTPRLALVALTLVLVLVGCVAEHNEALQALDADAGAPDTAAEAARVAPTEATSPPETFHCVVDTYTCNEYTGLPEPVPCTREEGPCGPPADPVADVCVVEPGHLRYYYHSVIPVDGGAILYGPLPPADCVHP